MFFIEPDLDFATLPADSFTIEVTFFLSTPSSCLNLAFSYPDYVSPNLFTAFSFYEHTQGKYRLDYIADRSRKSLFSPFFTSYDPTQWHEFQLSYKNGDVKVFVDGHCLLVIPQSGIIPRKLSFPSVGPIKYKKIRIAGGREVSSFDGLLKERKMVTHAINFDKGKHVIKPESIPFIGQMADFLKKNPGIKLEIIGHTDSDGTEQANQILSEERAAEVRTQLIKLGVDQKRLSSKGLGATHPATSNATPQGKAMNRRVEFLRQ